MKKLLLLVILSAFLSCGERHTEFPVLDIEAGMTAGSGLSGTFLLNDLFSEVEIIPIETRPDALMGPTRLRHIGRDHFYLAHNHKLSRVNRNGVIESTLSHQGRGPGEYLFLGLVDVNERESTIRVFDNMQDKYINYDMEGRLIDERLLSEKEIRLPLAIANDHMVATGRPGSDFICFVTDREGNIFQGFFPVDHTLSQSEYYNLTDQVGIGSAGGEGTLINLAQSDTLYHVDRQGMTPEAILLKGRYRRPEESVDFDPEKSDPANPRYMMSTSVSSIGNDHYLVQHVTESGLIAQIWNRQGSILAHTDTSDGIPRLGFRFSFPNGGTVLVPVFLSDGERVGFVIDAVHAVDSIEGIKEDDNPVIVIAKLK